MKTPPASRPASVLMVVMLVALALSIIVASFINLGTTAVRTTEANHTHHALALPAEEGLDRATSALQSYMEILRGGSPVIRKENQPMADAMLDSTSWSSVARAGFDNCRRLQLNGGNPIDLGNGRSAIVVVDLINVPTGDRPNRKPFAVAQVRQQGGALAGAPVTRQFAAYFQYTNHFDYGMLIPTLPGADPKYNRFNSNGQKVDISSYNELFARQSNVTLATTRTGDGAIAGSVNIYGHVSTGGDDPVDNMKGAHVWDASSPETYKYAGIDPACISRDFSADVPMLFSPVPYEKSEPLTIAGATASGMLKDGVLTLEGGTEAEPKAYAISENISVGGAAVNQIVVKEGSNILLNIGSTTSRTTAASLNPDLKISGTGSLVISGQSRLEIYTTGNVSITGQGVVNTTTPGTLGAASNLRLYGNNLTNVSTMKAQIIEVAGNGNFTGVIYAPRAEVKLSGGGSSGIINGSIVAFCITCNGGVDFHYDERLALLSIPIPELVYWVELKGDKRFSF